MSNSASLLTSSAWTGRYLQEALCEEASLCLSFYSYGLMLRKRGDNGGFVEYPVDASQVAQALAAKVCFDTGLMSDDILLVQKEGLRETVVGFRKAQKTGIWLEGSKEALRIPLPPLILIRKMNANSPSYLLFAVKKRPTSLDEDLFHAPLPNVYSSGSICWGNLRLNVAEGTSLAQDWNLLLGSPFGNHATGGKSQAFRLDIREQLLRLDKEKKRVYPKRDLLPFGKTLGQILEKDNAYAY